MNKTLTLAAIALVASAVTSQAGITVGTESNTATDLTWDGTWDGVADTATTTGSSWTATLQTDTLTLLGTSLLVIKVDGNHNELPLGGATWSAASALLNAAGQTGTAAGGANHNAANEDQWTLWTKVVGPNNVEWKVTATHVPEPSTYAMLAGLGLAGFALYRRMKA